jgi:hypothetical protein
MNRQADAQKHKKQILSIVYIASALIMFIGND